MDKVFKNMTLDILFISLIDKINGVIILLTYYFLIFY